MNSPSGNTLFHAQHKNKCYCQNRNLCYCTGIENPLRNSKHSPSTYKFVKVRSDKTKDNKHLNSISLCSTTNSFSPAPTMMTSLSSASSMRTASRSCNSSQPSLTGRRELYERSKMEGTGFNHNFNVCTWNIQEHILFSGTEVREQNSNIFNDEQIAKLQEFRLQNVDECLSSCNRYSVDKFKQLSKSKEPQEQIKYTLNSRGLLKSVGDNDDGQAAIVSSKFVVKDILRQRLNSSKEKDKLIRKALCLPENSLALRYQKTC
ncbi:uncharacterized protein LOC129917893 [Episyrphus balteatus]|uniref:uncharacterized protein LOC129917893 n=1 Tax=Episyrphus balteatus TaxID=286459 RepID=UPI00248506DA|nr:uncharacterized protein LOC129917893 [Episyrphus balteatus]